METLLQNHTMGKGDKMLTAKVAWGEETNRPNDACQDCFVDALQIER
jgi:hypothetical protein